VIEVQGQNVRDLSRCDIAKSMAYVAQQSEGNQLTVFDSILLGRKPYIKMNPSDEDIDIAQKAMERMGLERFALRYTDSLSGGELQKVVLARALAQQPKIMLLDEPTSNLDLYNQHEVLRVVSQIAKTDGISVIVIIHDLNLALRYCDRFLLVRDGYVYRYGDESVITTETIRDVYRVDAQIIDVHGRKMVVVE
jgi:iron complex transport system ATP-binding protein